MGIAFTRDGRGKEKEDDKTDPFGTQQTAFNTYGMNINSPPGYNTAFSGCAGNCAAAPPAGQQVATNKSDRHAWLQADSCQPGYNPKLYAAGTGGNRLRKRHQIVGPRAVAILSGGIFCADSPTYSTPIHSRRL